MTMLTDYVLAIAAAFFAVRLWRVGHRPWGLAFFFTAAASLFGGTYHGFAIEWLWKPTVYAIGLASMYLLLPFLPLVAIVKFILFASWMITHDAFVHVIADYGTTLVLLAGVQIVAWMRRRAPSAPWILGSIGVSVLGALVQQSGVALHRHFNHNDLYHVIQLVALWLLYRGGLLLTKRATDRPPIPPT